MSVTEFHCLRRLQAHRLWTHKWSGDFGREYDQWIRDGDGMVEPIFYSSPGAYDFQYLELAALRYSSDNHWLEEHL